jgi:hypothetical protein
VTRHIPGPDGRPVCGAATEPPAALVHEIARALAFGYLPNASGEDEPLEWRDDWERDTPWRATTPDRLYDARVIAAHLTRLGGALPEQGDMRPMWTFEGDELRRLLDDLAEEPSWTPIYRVRFAVDDNHLKWKINKDTWSAGVPADGGQS